MREPLGIVGNPVIQAGGKREQANQMGLDGIGQSEERAIAPQCAIKADPRGVAILVMLKALKVANSEVTSHLSVAPITFSLGLGDLCRGAGWSLGVGELRRGAGG